MRSFLVSVLLGVIYLPAFAADRAGAGCDELRVIPAVRECISLRTIPIGANGVSIQMNTHPEEKFALADLETAVRQKGIPARLVAASGNIELLSADTPAAKLLLHENHLELDRAMHDEGYAIVPRGKNALAVIAETSTGFFYGVQTVKQLVRDSEDKHVLLIPTVRDWPAMPHRGLSDDWSRGPLPNMEFLKREIRTLAAYKYNIFSPYFEHTFAYRSSPVAAFPGGAMTPEEAHALVEYAAKYHISVIPEQESFGHLHNVLKFEQYSPLGEKEHGSVLAPDDPNTLPQIQTWFKELAQIFPAPYVHIGADETFELGLGRTREKVEQQGLGKVYLDFLSSIHSALANDHKRLLFWGDIAVHSPDLVNTLPKDMIAVPWDYDAKPDFTNQIEPFTKAGLETWVAPGVNNWNRIYPNNNEAMGNIAHFVRDGQKLGATGMLNTVWNDDGETIFDENWFGVLFGAAAAWQSGESSDTRFMNAYGLSFHNDPTGKISEAQREIMAVHAAFKDAGLGDAQDNYYWLDPFDKSNESKVEKIRPILHDVRIHAERAITLLAEARQAAQESHRDLTNSEAIDALELGARRIDATALKFQAADDCLALYTRAQQLASDKSKWDEVGSLLATIGSSNGRLQDIRDGYTLINELYRTAWLKDNRPYWLDNNEARFDRAAQLWTGRGDAWWRVVGVWYKTHQLPDLEKTPLDQISN